MSWEGLKTDGSPERMKVIRSERKWETGEREREKECKREREKL